MLYVIWSCPKEACLHRYLFNSPALWANTYIYCRCSSVWAEVFFGLWLCQFSHQSFQLLQPIQMCLHTKPLIFHRKEEGLPPLRQLLCPTQGCLYLTVPLTHSPYRSLFLQHMPIVMLMSVTGSASQSGRPSHPPLQQAEVCNYRAVLGWMVWLVGWLRSADRGVCLA